MEIRLAFPNEVDAIMQMLVVTSGKMAIQMQMLLSMISSQGKPT